MPWLNVLDRRGGLAAVLAGGIDLLVLDYRLSGPEDGLTFYLRLKSDGIVLPVILVTGYSDDATIVRALRVGVRDEHLQVGRVPQLPAGGMPGWVLDQVRVEAAVPASRLR